MNMFYWKVIAKHCPLSVAKVVSTHTLISKGILQPAGCYGNTTSSSRIVHQKVFIIKATCADNYMATTLLTQYQAV